MAFPAFFPTGQDRVRGLLPQNWFFAKDQEKGPILLGTPGTARWINLGGSVMQVRGMKDMGDYLYVVAQVSATTCEVLQVDKHGDFNIIGTIATGTGPLYIVPMGNQKQLFISDNVNGYFYDLYPKTWVNGIAYLVGIRVQPTTPNLLYYICTGAGTSGATEPTWPTVVGETVADGGVTWECVAGVPYFAQITDPAFLGGGPAVLQDNYVVYAQPNSNQWGVSNLSDLSAYDAMAQALKGNDTIKGIISSHSNIWLMGAKSIEIWYNAGTSPFPFRKLGGTLIEKGLGAPMSPVIGDNTVMWLDNNRQVMMAQGFQPRRISTDKIDRELEKYLTIEDAIGIFQIQRGHSFYWLIFPTANRTLVCDISVNPPMWHVRSSFLDGSRHRANCYCYFNGMHLVGDYSGGDIYKLDPNVYTDDNQPMQAKVQSREFRAGGKYIPFPDLQFLFNSGGSPVGLDPQAMLRLSRDGGNSFGTERMAAMGQVGEYARRTIFRQNGSDYQRIFELNITDPVNRDILSCDWLE